MIFFSSGTHTPIRTPPNVEKYTLDGLEPYTLYKIVMSVETRLGEGQSSSPLLNRTGEGRKFFLLSFLLQIVLLLYF